MQSLTLLKRFNQGMVRQALAADAIAEVDIWGLVVGPSRGDDWPYTIRGERAQIVGPVHLSERVARGGDVAARYDVEVLIGSEEMKYVEREAEQ